MKKIRKGAKISAPLFKMSNELLSQLMFDWVDSVNSLNINLFFFFRLKKMKNDDEMEWWMDDKKILNEWLKKKFSRISQKIK